MCDCPNELTKREKFAKAVMQGLLAGPNGDSYSVLPPKEVTGRAVALADALLDELARGPAWPAGTLSAETCCSGPAPLTEADRALINGGE